MVKIFGYIAIFLLAALIGFFGYRRLGREDIQLPKGESRPLTEVTQESERKIFVTNGIKHSVPLGEVISGGPPKDGIPPIDNPKFISVKEAEEFLRDDEPGVAFSKGDTNRFYPYQILVWHEIVNDVIEGERALITYCPLCLTGYALDPIVKGERVEFGTSGKLWKSNLVMYDRKTDSLWSQVLGEAIVGEMTGAKLPVLPSDQVRFGEWKKSHPDGEVLSRDTGHPDYQRLGRYGQNPYGDYFIPTDFAVSMAGFDDKRLPADEFVFGVVINGKAKAYSTQSVKAEGLVEDEFQGANFVLRHEKELDAVRMFEKLPDGTLERINPVSGFWFSWVSAYPQTEVYPPPESSGR